MGKQYKIIANNLHMEEEVGTIPVEEYEALRKSVYYNPLNYLVSLFYFAPTLLGWIASYLFMIPFMAFWLVAYSVSQGEIITPELLAAMCTASNLEILMNVGLVVLFLAGLLQFMFFRQSTKKTVFERAFDRKMTQRFQGIWNGYSLKTVETE